MSKKTLVIGASINPQRYSFLACKFLKENNIPFVAMGLREGDIFGQSIVKNIDWNNSDIHTITLYLNIERQEEYLSKIINSGCQRIIFNPGTENPKLFKMAENKGIEVLNACTLVLLRTGMY